MHLDTSALWRFTLTVNPLSGSAWGGRAEVWCGLRLVSVFASFMYEREAEVRTRLEAEVLAYIAERGGSASRFEPCGR
jgi:hypothetical protein